jgi:hypothetical protein
MSDGNESPEETAQELPSNALAIAAVDEITVSSVAGIVGTYHIEGFEVCLSSVHYTMFLLY